MMGQVYRQWWWQTQSDNNANIIYYIILPSCKMSKKEDISQFFLHVIYDLFVIVFHPTKGYFPIFCPCDLSDLSSLSIINHSTIKNTVLKVHYHDYLLCLIIGWHFNFPGVFSWKLLTQNIKLKITLCLFFLNIKVNCTVLQLYSPVLRGHL